MTSSGERAETAAAVRPRVPDFFIVGHAKSGTTALYEMLKRHPQIFMPMEKEPWYFARDNPQPQTSAERSIEFTGRRTMSFEEYTALFTPAREDQRVGEASTSYLWSPSAAAAIAEAHPEARIIAILREPASFLRSLHLQLLSNTTEEEKDLRKAIALDDARREGREIPKHAFWPRELIYSDRVRYVEQLRRYHSVFPPEQVLVLIYDDFRSDNAATIDRVLRFLDVDPDYPIEVKDVNPTTRRVRSARINNLVRVVRHGRGPVSGAVKRSIERLMSKEVRRRVIYPIKRGVLYGDPKPPDERLMKELRQRFKGEVVALSEYLGRDLVTLWGYDNLD
jgi:Sulfotransferase family